MSLYIFIVIVVFLSNGWVLQVVLCVKFEKDERGDVGIELGECSHDLVIDILVVFLSELVSNEPGDGFALEFDLVIVAFDGDENFANALCMNAKVHPFKGDSAAVCNKFY